MVGLGATAVVCETRDSSVHATATAGVDGQHIEPARHEMRHNVAYSVVFDADWWSSSTNAPSTSRVGAIEIGEHRDAVRGIEADRLGRSLGHLE